MHTALESGLKSSAYVKLIAWLSNEISTLGKLEEKVTICMEDENQIDTNSFMMELSAFLKELGCPYQFFTTGKFLDIGQFITAPSGRNMFYKFKLMIYYQRLYFSNQKFRQYYLFS